jgi:FkbM family methyltransferase
MTIKTKIRKRIIDITGYWIYKHKDLPVGCDLITDLKLKIQLPIGTVFDVGANIGQTTLLFNENFSNAEIFSFEPVSKTFNELNIRVKNLKNIKCHNLALGDKEEFINIKLFEDDASVLNSLNADSMNNNGNYKVERIEVTTGDKFCFQNEIHQIDLLKIDTEGYEIKVLNGFLNMMENSRIKALYCEVGFNPSNRRNTFINELINFINQKGYTFYGLYEVSNVQIKDRNNFGNILFLKNELLKS